MAKIIIKANCRLDTKLNDSFRDNEILLLPLYCDIVWAESNIEGVLKDGLAIDITTDNI